MKQFIFFSLTLFVLASCRQIHGSGNIVTEKRQPGNFTGISVGGEFRVELKNGTATEVVVEADDNIIGLIETTVSGGVLKIRTKENTNLNNAHTRVYITAPEIRSVKSSGASDVKMLDELKNNGKLSFEVSGAGSIKGRVDAPEIFADISGAGNIELAGRTKNYNAEITGSGTLRTSDLRSENTDVNVSGAGNAHVHASVTLKVKASGAGNVYYKGGANVQQSLSGAASVKSEN